MFTGIYLISLIAFIEIAKFYIKLTYKRVSAPKKGELKMERKNKVIASMIALFLTLTIASPLILLPTASAHNPPIQMTSWPFLVASPDPVGVGQRVIIVMWVDKPLPGAAVNNDVRRHNYTLTITKPDNNTETEHWDTVQDTTSIQYLLYTPDQVGTYTLKFEYGGQLYPWNATSTQRQWTGDTFLGSSKTITLTVQQEPLPEPRSSYPLPTEYWTRPIEGQNTDWWAISSNWLGGAYTLNNIQPDGAGPNTSHIMWTKPVQDGGVVGGSTTTGLDGDTYYSGMAYQTRVSNPIIMHGRLYYELPYGNAGGGGGWMAVDLQTGEKLWYNASMGTGSMFNPVPEPSFGYLYDLQYENQHGTIGNGWLISQGGFGNNLTWRFIEPTRGEPVNMVVTNVPSPGAGFLAVSGPQELVGPHGQLLRYQLNIQNGWLAQWNSSKTVWSTTSGGFGPVESGNIDGSRAYDWNKTNAQLKNLPSSSSIRASFFEDIMLVSDIQPAYSDGAFTIWGTNDPYTVAAISLKPGLEGNILWTKQYNPKPNNVTRQWAGADPVNRIFVMKDVEPKTFSGYSMNDGSLVWGPTPSQPDYDYFNLQSFVAYDQLYSSGYGGIVFSYSMKNGTLLWTYGNGGEGNSTDAGLVTAWGRYPQFIMAIADGKIFTATYEHSPNSPHYKGMSIRAIDAYTGKEIWKIMGAGSAFEMGSKAFAVASGYAVWLNAYDMQLYVAGKGPSSTTVTASPKVAANNQAVLIEGTVMDIASGTKQKEQAARFPNGVPAVSDKSMSAWMEYVYMQKPRPMDTVGVDVALSVVDANGNYRDIGTTTSNADGFYSFKWTPDIPGTYTVYASFGGSEGYWPSHAVSAFVVDEAPAVTAVPTQAASSVADLYFVPAVAGIIVAIIVVGAILALLLVRKRP